MNHTTDYIRKLESTLLAQLITQQRQAEQQQLQPGGTLAAKMNIHPGTASSNPEELLKIIRERVKNIVLESKKNKKAEEGEHIASLDQVRRKQMTIVAAPLTTEEEPPSSSNEV